MPNYTSANYVANQGYGTGINFSETPNSSGQSNQTYISGLDKNMAGAEWKNGSLLLYGKVDPTTGKRQEYSTTNFDPASLKSLKFNEIKDQTPSFVGSTSNIVSDTSGNRQVASDASNLVNNLGQNYGGTSTAGGTATGSGGTGTGTSDVTGGTLPNDITIGGVNVSALIRSSMGTPSASSSIDDYIAKYKQYTGMTPADQTTIENAGKAIGSQYDTIINQTKTQAGQGQGKADIAAGQVGGFMSSQYVGANAVPREEILAQIDKLRSEGIDITNLQNVDTRYGTGGYLAQIKSEYDNQISSLEAQKVVAVQQAKDAAEQAIKTGKETDLQNAYKMMESAQNAAQAQITKTSALVNMLSSVQSMSQSNQLFPAQLQKTWADAEKAQADNIQQTIVPALNNELSAATTPEEQAKVFQNYVDKGYDPTQLASGIATYRNDQQKQGILNASNTASILGNTKLGGTVDIPGFGKATVVGTDGKAPTTLDTQQGIMQWNSNTNSWQQTGFKKDDLSGSSLLSFMAKASVDPTVALNYLKALGYNVPTMVSGGGNVQWTPPTDVTARTDRNNNLIAAAVKTGGNNDMTKALTDAGIQWSYGDNFPGDKTMQTIKINDPSQAMDAARAILSNSNSIQNWYINHTGKDILSQYGVTNNKDFSKLPSNIQDEVIKGIYKSEVGHGDFKEITTTVDANPPDPKTANVVDKTTGQTPQTLWYEAIKYAQTDKAPTISAGFGGNAMTKEQIAKFKQSIVDKKNAILAAAGISDPAQLTADYAAMKSADRTLVTQAVGIGAYEGQALKNADLVETYNKSVQRTGSPLANRYVNWEKGQIQGNTPLSQLEVAIYAFTKEYAKVTSGGALSASALTDSASKEAANLLSAAMRPEQLSGVISVMKQEMENRRVSMNEELFRLPDVTPSLKQFHDYISSTAVQQGGNEPGVPNKNQDTINNVVDFIHSNNMQGNDQKISPVDYNGLKQQWVGHMLDPKDFDLYFAIYRDPNNKNYKLN